MIPREEILERARHKGLRLRKTGNVLLYVRELTKNGQAVGRTRSYKIQEIQSAHITQQVFMPWYAIEL